MPQIYLSYASQDTGFAERLARALERAGIQVESADKWQVADDQPLWERIEAFIGTSDAVIYVHSPAAERSAEVQREIAHARALPRLVIEIGLQPSARTAQHHPQQPEHESGSQRAPVEPVDDQMVEEMAQAVLNIITNAASMPHLHTNMDDIRDIEDARSAPAPPTQSALESPDSAISSPSTLAEPPAAGPATGALAPAPAPSRARASKAAKEAATETLQFSAYHANTLAVEQWNTLLVYAAAGDALAAVAADAATFTELGSAPRTSTGQSSRAVAQGAELTIEPHLEGINFSPPSDTFIWRGGWHRSLFRFQIAAALAGGERTGWVDIYAGPMQVPIARLDLTFTFTAPRPALALDRPAGRTVTSNPHDTVFISYSHHDREAFRQACEEYARFGITVFTDEHLEAGADYARELGQMIAGARVFHLLWSPTSAGSVECKKEWMAALLREPTERFIKPWYWRQPLPAPPSEFAQHHISFRYQRLRRKFWKPETWR